MKVSVFGIGYVGAVTAACLADMGHDVIACDISEEKVRCLLAGRSPIVEKDLPELIAKGVQSGRLSATVSHIEAVQKSDISLICVGTPGYADGSQDTGALIAVCEQIGAALRDKNDFHVVANRSTVLPGTTVSAIIPALERASGKKAGVNFGVGSNPEFMREGSAIADYFNPTRIVVGSADAQTARTIMTLYEGIQASRTVCDIEVAEGVKYASNAWRASKVGFANEMGNILKTHGVDSHKVMNIFFNDSINLGRQFLMPGFAFGGSCLPKDIRAIRASANDKGLSTPFFDSLLAANDLQIRRGFELIRQTGRRKIGLLGVSFKPGTDDVRESPLATLAAMIVEAGLDVFIYDPCVSAAVKNGRSVEASIAERLVERADDFVQKADAFVIGNATPEFIKILETVPGDAPVIDLVRLHPNLGARASYAGICW